MALSGNTVWEIRTGGDDTNGGGFVTGASGTDWSQQTAPQYSVTNGVTAGTTTITSTTAAFGTDVVGNIIYVQGGTGSVTAGWYQITARASATSITVDRSTGLTAGTGVTLHIGGALASVGQVGALMVSTNIAYVKYNASAYNITSAATNVAGGCFAASASQSVLIGYDVTRTPTNTDANIPTLLASGISSATILAPGGNLPSVRNLIIDGANLSAITGLNGGSASCTLYCTVTRCVTGFLSAKVVNCTAFANSGIGFSGCQAFGCVAYSNTGVGFSTGSHTINCIAYGNTGGGFTAAIGNGSILNCVAYGNTAHGFSVSGVVNTSIGCVAEGNSTFGFILAATGLVLSCFTFNNTSGSTSGTANVQNSITNLSSSPFVNAASNNFAPNNTASAGASLRAANWAVNTYSGLAGATTGYADIGVQHQDTPALYPIFD